MITTPNYQAGSHGTAMALAGAMFENDKLIAIADRLKKCKEQRITVDYVSWVSPHRDVMIHYAAILNSHK